MTSTRTNPLRRSRQLVTVAAVLALLVVSACGDDSPSSSSSPTTAPSAARPTTTATLQIVRPAPNEETGPDVTLELELVGAGVVSETKGELVPDKGHVHVSVDGKLISMAYGTTQDLHDLEPGPHTVQAEFVAIDHAPFRNRVMASVLFTVKP